MTFNIDDCKAAIKASNINPFFTIATDWTAQKRFKHKGNWVYQMFSVSMATTLYVTNHSYGNVVTVERPGTSWAFKVLDPDQWVGPGDVTFQVYDQSKVDANGEPIIDWVGFISDKFPPHTIEVSPGVYYNGNFTERNMREMMEALDFTDETPAREEVLIYPSAALDAEKAEMEAAAQQEETEESINNKKINDILGKLKNWKK